MSIRKNKKLPSGNLTTKTSGASVKLRKDLKPKQKPKELTIKWLKISTKA